VQAPDAEPAALTKTFFVGGVEKSRQFLATHPNAIGICYQPGDKPKTIKRTILQSKSFNIPAGSIAELEKCRGGIARESQMAKVQH
jgi:hypothetical protein